MSRSIDVRDTQTGTGTDVVPFYLRNVVSTVPGHPNPVTEFASGADIGLSWESNGTAFKLYAANDPNPLYSGTATSYVVRGGRKAPTTFILIASVSGGPGSGTPRPGFETINLYDALTVIISDPTLTPAAVTTGALTVTGTTTLHEVQAGATTVGGALTVTGSAALSGGATVGSAFTVNGDATVNGVTTMESASVTAKVTAASSSLGEANATSLSVSSWVEMMNPHAIGAGTYTPSSDGLVMGSVGFPSDSGKKCSAVATGSSAATGSVYATGGNAVVSSDGSNFLSWRVGNSFVLPVKKGAAFTISAIQAQYNEVVAPVTFAWVPFGTQAQLTELSDAEAAAAGLPGAPVLAPVAPSEFEPDFAISEILDVFAEVTGTPVPEAEAARLVAALRQLVTHTA
jgi:hypothetical protein